jgi:hypothetical protein
LPFYVDSDVKKANLHSAAHLLFEQRTIGCHVARKSWVLGIRSLHPLPDADSFFSLLPIHGQNESQSGCVSQRPLFGTLSVTL